MAIVPADFLHGVLLTHIAAGVAAHDCLPELLGYLGLADIVFAEGYLVGGILVAAAIVVAHIEGAVINIHHIKLDAVGLIFSVSVGRQAIFGS